MPAEATPAPREGFLTAIVIFGSLLAVALWEFWRRRRRLEFPAARRRLVNIGFWIVNLVEASFVLPASAAAHSALAAIHLPAWPVPAGAPSLVAGFLILDLVQYLIHRCEHAVPLFWRFNALHHSDPDVDVTTSVRHHPVEYVPASAVYLLAVVVLDIPAVVALTHSLAVFGAAALQHGNIRLPRWLERWLQPVLVTVDMHRVHHSILVEQASSNYGAVFSVWDRLFGTYTNLSRAQHDNIVFGVRELPRRECLQPAAMLLTPWLLSREGAGERPGGNGSRPTASVAGTRAEAGEGSRAAISRRGRWFRSACRLCD